MGCSCHISPPCGYCEQTYECSQCGKLKHPDENGLTITDDAMYCDSCVVMYDKKAKRIEALRTGLILAKNGRGIIHSWRRISEIICEEFPEENQDLKGNQMHGIDLCRDAMLFLYGVIYADDQNGRIVPQEVRDKWNT